MTPEQFDKLVKPRQRRLWGRPAIARFLGVSEDTVSTWAKDPTVPIYQPRRGCYCAYPTELETWTRTKVAV